MLKLMFLTSLLALLTIVTSNYIQKAYQIVYERTTLEWIDNETIIEPTKIVTFKYNRSTAACNMTVTFSKDVDYSLILVETFKFASNEYRQFPMRFQFDYCKALRENDFGLSDTLKCGNFTGCPLKKGTIFACNLRPDASHSPPLIPFGSYMTKLTYLYEGRPIMISKFYATVKYPIKYQ